MSDAQTPPRYLHIEGDLDADPDGEWCKAADVEALQKHGRHPDECGGWQSPDRCTCGLEIALHPGVWTQAEINIIKQEAAERFKKFEAALRPAEEGTP